MFLFPTNHMFYNGIFQTQTVYCQFNKTYKLFFQVTLFSTNPTNHRFNKQFNEQCVIAFKFDCTITLDTSSSYNKLWQDYMSFTNNLEIQVYSLLSNSYYGILESLEPVIAAKLTFYSLYQFVQSLHSNQSSKSKQINNRSEQVSLPGLSTPICFSCVSEFPLQDFVNFLT